MSIEVPRVVITGVGLLLPNSNTPSGKSEVIESRQALYDKAESGVPNIGHLPDYVVDIAHNVADEDGQTGAVFPEDFEPFDLRPEAKKIKEGRASFATRLTVAATYQALEDAGLHTNDLDPTETGTAISTSTGPVDLFEYAMRSLIHQEEHPEEYQGDTKTLQKRALERALFPMIRNGLSDETVRVVSKASGIQGIALNGGGACATTIGNLGQATHAIQLGQADRMLVGGAESFRSKVWIEVFRLANIVATGFNDHPTEASRPGDIDRNGLVPSEGAGIVVLERLDRVLEEGREERILAEVLSFGGAIDKNGVVFTDARPFTSAIRKSLQLSSLTEVGTDVVLPHMTSTPSGDETEAEAVYITNPRGIIYASKAVTGHAFAASGAMNIALAIEILRRQKIPRQINLITRGTRVNQSIEPGYLGQVRFADHEYSGSRAVNTIIIQAAGMQGVIYSAAIKKYEPYSPF